MLKKRLLTPGPTQVPEAARLSLARQVEHHRTPEFVRTLDEVLEGLKYVFRTAADVVVLTSSGTGAMETAVTNVVPRGGKALVLDAGRFAQRWGEICQAYGIEVVRHRVAWGQAVEAVDVARMLREHPDVVAVFGTLMESSTGVTHDVQAIGQVVRAADLLWIVDAISGAGVVECRTDDWAIDMLVVGSQKALMLPPGLAFVSVNKRAWKQIDTVKPQAFYFDLKHYRQALRNGPDTPWTPAHTLVAALAENLKQIRADGIEHVWERARILGRATRAGLEASGLEIFAQRPADGMTAVRFPAGLDGGAFLKRLESRFGVKLASGQGQLKGKIFRLAHMGLIDELDILGVLSALELVLAEMGREVRFGAGAAAASQVLADAQAAITAQAAKT